VRTVIEVRRREHAILSKEPTTSDRSDEVEPDQPVGPCSPGLAVPGALQRGAQPFRRSRASIEVPGGDWRAAAPGNVAEGIPAGWGAPQLAAPPDADASVWPTPHGSATGRSITPLYPGAERAAAEHSELHAILSLVDILRSGSPAARRREATAQLYRRIPLSRPR
jgi:hypothetical protein